uniref:Uncharacterized protein n=1 Tax=Ditylenchus dipsaci TaxID=166011 RepID=A0A915D2G7_9BILA
MISTHISCAHVLLYIQRRGGQHEHPKAESDEYEEVEYYEEVYEDAEEGSATTSQHQTTDANLLAGTQSTEASADNTEIINTLLSKGSTIPHGYDWRVRPPGTNLSLPGNHGPVIVKVDMLIRSISKIDDVNMEYSVQLTFRESWVDGRLAFGLPNDTTPPFVILTAGQQIWMPDSFFQNEKHAQKHMIDKPNVLIRVHKDGVILYSVRISLVLSCPMHLQYYPMDVQTCLIDLASYAYTTEDIEYEWKATDPVQLKSGLESSLPPSSWAMSTPPTAPLLPPPTLYSLHYACYCVLGLFLVGQNSSASQSNFGSDHLLTMTTQASGINAKLPPVSYSKAIDIWCGACLTFIFGALLEFACVTYMASRMFYKAKNRPTSMVGVSLGGGNGSFSALRTSTGVSLAQPSAALITSHRASFAPSLKNTPLLMTNYSAIQPADEEEEEQVKLKQEDTEDVWVRQSQMPMLPQPVLRSREPKKEPIDLEKATQLYKKEPSPPPSPPRQPSPKTIYRRRRSSAVGFMKRWCPGWRWMSRQLDIEDRAKRADYISRLMFPVAFILFNLIYWLRYSRYEITWPWNA